VKREVRPLQADVAQCQEEQFEQCLIACISPSLERCLYFTCSALEKIMASVSLRLPDEVTQRLENLAALTGRSKTFYMVEAICEHIDDLEDLYLAERELEAIPSGKSQTVPLAELMKRYGMEG
jgi:RHH-type rel operon transcriptional repressor/antitoxin RelB